MTETNRITLRELPLAARLVLSVFLISVGIGYISAMVQIHFKHAGKGDPMPTPADLVGHFSGREWPLQSPEVEPEPEKKAEVKFVPPAIMGNELVAGAGIKWIIDSRCAVCHAKDGEKSEPLLDTWENVRKLVVKGKEGKLYKVITAEGTNFNKQNMRGAFKTKHPDWKDDSKERPAAELLAEREIERLTLIAWVENGAKEEYYGEGKFFPIPETPAGKAITKEARGQANALSKVVTAGVVADKPEDNATSGKKKRSFKSKQISLESLTQSTHAHLLAFSVLWTVLGLTFAFTTYPMWLRCTVAPAVLIAQVLDIGFWWLARLEGIGPYFALGIMATGAVVGLGVVTQILLSLFNMYGNKGRAVLVVLAMMFAAGGGLVAVKVVLPQLEAEKLELSKGE